VPIGASLSKLSGRRPESPGRRSYRIPLRFAQRMSPSPILTRSLALPVAAVAIALAVAGCGTSSPDTQRGRQLFINKCGSCHTLAQAATTGQQGPNLDGAFAAARAAGEDGDTIEGVVKAQIEFPRPSTSNPNISMPRDLVTGQDRDDVAAYVGSFAGVPGAGPPKVPGGPGAQVFANNGCSGCHTLAAANSGGTTGPNLDKVLPGQTAAMITQSIVTPNAKIAAGYPANVMPQNFEQLIPAPQLKLLVSYLLSSTGGGKPSSGSAAKSPSKPAAKASKNKP
jgi:mono/diheme cytochrome c family protein